MNASTQKQLFHRCLKSVSSSFVNMYEKYCTQIAYKNHLIDYVVLSVVLNYTYTYYQNIYMNVMF